MKRLSYIDAVRGLNILFVCLGHIFPYILNSYNPGFRWFSSFQIGLFFLISGFVIAAQSENGYSASYGGFFVTKFKSVLWPYLTFSVIAIGIRTVSQYVQGILTKDSFLSLIVQTVTFDGLGVLWFLPCLFIGLLIAYPAMKNRIASVAVLLLSFAGILSVPFLQGILPAEDTVLELLPHFVRVLLRGIISGGFIVLGYHLFPLAKKLLSCSVKTRLIAGLICLAASVTIAQFTGTDFRALYFIGPAVLSYLNVIAAMISFSALLPFLEKCGAFGNTIYQRLIFWGQNTVAIFCTHMEWLLFPILCFGMSTIFGPLTVIGERYWIRGFIVLALLMLMENSLIDLINHYAPWLIKLKKVVKGDGS